MSDSRRVIADNMPPLNDTPGVTYVKYATDPAGFKVSSFGDSYVRLSINHSIICGTDADGRHILFLNHEEALLLAAALADSVSKSLYTKED